ncbi:ABC transporter ATP-binding protein [Butyrivibrio sp. YAB3001]|uniref:ABC transporter ATP-binding protein n=1 Tax=Butyrivibrio sp. YAB3001 TaxID=1520812 RepID=UPI0008F629E4|nr:ABC transporter ATP-binding protein [Butyrivibrio sp. YAB3001]SFB99164.1 ABC-type multidrug transport system, ATPase and permease component [Butyrivibrio sp. YAB3001]
MWSEYEESKDNPLHKEFGIWSNTRFILKKMAQYKPEALWLMAIGMVCSSVMSYFWGIFGKYVIDIIQMGLSEDEAVKRLVGLIAVAGSVAFVLLLGNAVSNNMLWYKLIHIRMNMITERVSKVLNLRYELIERPDVLDVAMRASQATGGNNNGVEGMMHLMQQILTSLLTVVVTFIAVTVLDFRLIIALFVLSVLQFIHYKKIITIDKENVWDKLSNSWRKISYMERVTQDFDQAKDIRLFNLSGFLTKKQEEIYRERLEKLDLHNELWFKHSTIVQITYVVIKVLIYITLFMAVLNKGLQVGDFTMFLSFSLAFSSALVDLLQKFGDYKKVSLETDDYRSFIELEIEDDEKDCIPLPEADSFEIEFKNVSYTYPKSEKEALKGLNLKLHVGEKLAVVGLNGAGKTTMIKLLLRLYDPTEGSITLNGTDIRRYKRADYYKLFAPVFQNVEIFAFLMSENIAMKSEQDLDRNKVLKSAIEAGLGEKLTSLGKGIDSPLTNIVEEDGVDLSGGEKQKLALARALYKGSRIIVLDEPTSALDAIAEQRLYEQFDEMIGEKSAVYISHRLASTRFCDRVAMFENGELVELGSHEELMEKGGKYAEMFNVQAHYYREDDMSESEVEKVG